MKHFTLSLLVALFLLGCSSEASRHGLYTPLYQPEYASGLRILTDNDSVNSLIVTLCPWQGADSTNATSLMVIRDGSEAPEGFDGQVIHGDARRIVCMSSTHVAMLDALGAVDRVVGVSGIDYISNPYVQAHRDTIADVGYEGNIDYERLAALAPDLVMLYGVNGMSTMEPKLRELGIPFIYIGEYLEESPLGKAEWLMAVAEVTGQRERGREVFSKIPANYHSLCKLVADSVTGRPERGGALAPRSVSRLPRVMVNTPYGDQWVMPSTGSYVARLIADAGGQYVYTKNTSNASQPIDLEEAYMLASTADRWINVGQLTSLAELKSRFPKFADTRPVTTGQVWNTTLAVTPAGGNDYWESGIIHPDLVLQDLIKIFHPTLLSDRPFTYYTRL